MKCEECGVNKATVEMLVDGEMEHLCQTCLNYLETLNQGFLDALETDAPYVTAPAAPNDPAAPKGT